MIKMPGLSRIVQVGLLAVIAVSPTQFSIEVFEKTHLSIVDPLIWLVAAIRLIDIFRKRSFSTLKPPHLSIVLFVGLFAVSVFKSANFQGSLKNLFQLTEYFLVAYILFNEASADDVFLKRAAIVSLVTAVCVIALAVVQYLTPSLELFRVSGSFGNRNVLGGFLALVVPLMFGVVVSDTCFIRRVMLSFIIIAALLVTLSGATMIALVISLLLLSCFKGRWTFPLATAVILA
ncbi:MAG: hypothetical protein JXN60_05930, partial [Lentisphaerae bacterium]|nr:hypothetical protein [Lentisphaerota bacterium]